MDAKVLNELERQRAEHEEKLARAAGWFPAEPRVAGTLAELSIGIIAAAVLWILRWIATTRTVAITLGRGEARVALGPGVAGDGVSIGAGGAAASWASGGAGGGVYQTGPQSFVSTHQGGAGGSGGGVGGAGAYDERAAMLRELRALQEKVKAYQQATAPYVAEASDVEPVHLEALLRRMWMAAPTAAPEAPDKSPILASAQKALDEATAALTGADRYPGADAAERVGAAVSALGDLRTALDELEKADRAGAEAFAHFMAAPEDQPEVQAALAAAHAADRRVSESREDQHRAEAAGVPDLGLAFRRYHVALDDAKGAWKRAGRALREADDAKARAFRPKPAAEHVHAFVLETIPPRCVCGAVEPMPAAPSGVTRELVQEVLAAIDKSADCMSARATLRHFLAGRVPLNLAVDALADLHRAAGLTVGVVLWSPDLAARVGAALAAEAANGEAL